MAICAPFYSEENLRSCADEFLTEYHPSRAIPVPIEAIIEYQFDMDIVPMPGLHANFDTDAYITSDFQEIRVDQAVYESRENRYRFSLAHELGHRVLHQTVFESLSFSTIEEWKSARQEIPEREYRYIEWHANCFAGLVLVPPVRLAEKFNEALGMLDSQGMSIENAGPVAWDYIEGWLAVEFVVSAQVISKRGPADGLWESD